MYPVLCDGDQVSSDCQVTSLVTRACMAFMWHCYIRIGSYIPIPGSLQLLMLQATAACPDCKLATAWMAGANNPRALMYCSGVTWLCSAAAATTEEIGFRHCSSRCPWHKLGVLTLLHLPSLHHERRTVKEVGSLQCGCSGHPPSEHEQYVLAHQITTSSPSTSLFNSSTISSQKGWPRLPYPSPCFCVLLAPPPSCIPSAPPPPPHQGSSPHPY